MPRNLDWEGCFNVRDLGGLPTRDGRLIRSGVAVRADSLHKLTPSGWEAVVDHGVRTVIDLRNDDERDADLVARPPALTTIHLPLDGRDDEEFWGPFKHGPQFGTPLYYRPHLERMPARSAAVLTAIARARPGGVVFHCVGGRDRTGQIAILLLALAGVGTHEIVADYELTDNRLPAFWAAVGWPDQRPITRSFLAARQTSAPALITGLLESFDYDQALAAGGLSTRDLDTLRRRLCA